MDGPDRLPREMKFAIIGLLLSLIVLVPLNAYDGNALSVSAAMPIEVGNGAGTEMEGAGAVLRDTEGWTRLSSAKADPPVSERLTQQTAARLYQMAFDDVASDSISTSDVSLASTADSKPIIDVWYGSNQRFGHIGTAQRWVNILGNASDPDGLASLSYSLNQGSDVHLFVGPDSRRLAKPGDFNIDIDIGDLASGLNEVIITATDTLGNIATETITVDYVGDRTWPIPYTVDWGQAQAIQEVAQVVDGPWELVGDGVRPTSISYDRLVAIGDVNWTSYEVVVPLTVHSVDAGGFAFPSMAPGLGLLVHWTGHTDDPVAGWQPKSGWKPFGAIGWWRWLDQSSARLEFAESGIGKDFTPTVGVRYLFKLRAESTPNQGAMYRMKVWEEGQPEPGQWDLNYSTSFSHHNYGSLLLLAHHVDATFGEVTVSPLPLEVSEVAVSTTASTATLSWRTDEPATGTVSYGLTPAYELGSVTGASLVTQDTVTLTDLSPSTTYYYKISAVGN
jgi:hypothetical protein